MKKFALIITLALPFFFTSCGGGSSSTEEQSQDTVAQAQTATVDLSEGEKIYKEKCVVCHMADGAGVANTFPPLKGSDYLLADKKRAVHQVLHGSSGEMVVNGVTYNNVMPPQPVSKEQAVAVINYVLNSFGNQGGFVTMEEVADIEMPVTPPAK